MGIRKRGHRPGGVVNIVGHESFILSLQQVIHSVTRYKGSLRRVADPKVKCMTVTINGNHAVELFSDWIYKDATCFLERKHNRFLKIKIINSIKENFVEQLDNFGVLVARHENVDAAVLAVGGNRCAMISICNGSASSYRRDGTFLRKKTTYLGFRWRYIKIDWKSFVSEENQITSMADLVKYRIAESLPA